jgi:thymidylate synthase
MMAQVCGFKAGEFIHTLGDAHIYTNHFDQVELQLSRAPKPLATLKLNPNISDLFDFKYEDIEVLNYDPHPGIKGAVAV